MEKGDAYKHALYVRELARSRFRPGTIVAALFKNGPTQRIIQYVMNPVDVRHELDIPADIYTQFGNKLYLDSVQTLEAMQDFQAHEHALVLQRTTRERANAETFSRD
jgi:hypothetical protein